MSYGAGQAAAGVFDTLVTSWMNQQSREDEKRLQEAKKRAVNTQLAKANTTYDQMMNLLNQYNDNRISVADDSMVNQYKDLISNYNPQTYDFDEFRYKKTVDDFLNPEAEKIAQLAGLQTQNDLAGQGAAKGTGALASLGYSRVKAAEDLYKDAQAQYNADRTQAYTEYNDYIKNMQNKLDTISKGQLDKAKLLGGAIQNEQTQQSDYMSDLLGLMSDKTSTNINATLGAF